MSEEGNNLRAKNQEEEEVCVVAFTPPARKDNKLFAIIAMNIAAFCTTGMTATYRVIADDFHPAEFNVLRNLTSFVAASIWLKCLGNGNPCTLFPRQQKGVLAVRILTGQANFLLLSLAAPLAPLALIMVFWQTSPFWITIVAYCWLSEPVIPLELVSMILCFTAVVVIAM